MHDLFDNPLIVIVVETKRDKYVHIRSFNYQYVRDFHVPSNKDKFIVKIIVSNAFTIIFETAPFKERFYPIYDDYYEYFSEKTFYPIDNVEVEIFYFHYDIDTQESTLC